MLPRTLLLKRVRLNLEAIEDRLPPGDLGFTGSLALPEFSLPWFGAAQQTRIENGPVTPAPSARLAEALQVVPPVSGDPLVELTPQVITPAPADARRLTEALGAQPWEANNGGGTIQGGPEDLVVGPNVLTHNHAPCPNGRGRTQSETTITVSGAAVIVAYNDFRGFQCPNEGPGYQVTGWSYSLDYGTTFVEGGPLPGRTQLSGDPWLATGPDGTIYLASLRNGTGGLAVLRGTVTESGISWSEPTAITLAGNSFDKEALTVDPYTGNVYITYTRFGGPGGIWSYRSLDGGLTFEGPTPVRPVGGVQGSFPVVGPNSELYVAWNVGYPNNSGIGFTRSLDFGQTFEPHVQFDDVCNFLIPGMDRGTHPLLPTMAVDLSGGPSHGAIYIAYATACYSGNGDVVLRRSDDGGTTWSDSMLINDDFTPGLQWYPSVSVDAVGNVNVFFYDRREHPGTITTNLYFAQSADQGATFTNVKVTDTPSNWLALGESPNYGDYINSLSWGTFALVAYADGRDGDPDTYFAWVAQV